MKNILILLSLLFSPIVLLAGANLDIFDEPLGEEASRVVAQERAWDAQNSGFAFLYGISSDSSVVPQHRVAEILTLIEDEGPAGVERIEKWLSLRPEDNEWKRNFSALGCDFRGDSECFSVLVEQGEAQGFVAPRLSVMLLRYEELLAQTQFEEPPFLNWESPLPNIDLAMDLSLLRLTKAYNSGQQDIFISQLAQDMSFWRMALVNSYSLISKMVANAILHRDLAFLSFYLRHHELSEENTAKAFSLVTPLSQEERDISEAFLEEFKITVKTGDTTFSYTDTSLGQDILQAIAFQPNATLNDFYTYFTSAAVRLSAKDGKAFTAALERDDLNYPGTQMLPPSVFNLAGKLSLQKNASGYIDYIGRMHNLSGIYILLKIQLLAKTQPLEELLQNPSYSSPFANTPMTFDLESQRLGFECFKNLRQNCHVFL